MPSIQGSIWLLTIPSHHFLPYLPSNCKYIKGQLETGVGGFVHWQVIVTFSRSVRLGALKSTFGDACHAELSRSDAADAYVWKDDTAVEGTRFELGSKPLKRNCPKDWDDILVQAKTGDFEKIPSDIVVRCYGQLSRIARDHLQPVGFVRTCEVFWGRTSTGKSRRAWDEAGNLFCIAFNLLGLDAFPKDPRTKFWDGYRGHQHVVIDEFRGGIDIAHMLRWLDRYPVIVEIKGGSVVLKAEKIWITSNLNPDEWYPLADDETRLALRRRLNVVHFN